MAPYLILNLGDTNHVRCILLVHFINKETDGQSGSAIFLQLGSLETKTQFSENESSAFFQFATLYFYLPFLLPFKYLKSFLAYPNHFQNENCY